MSKDFGPNRFKVLSKARLDDYPLDRKTKKLVNKNHASYMLIDEQGRMVAYEIYNGDNRIYTLVDSHFQEKYKKYIPAFHKKVVSNMKEKALLTMLKKATVGDTIVEVRNTPIPMIHLIYFIYIAMIAAMVVSQQIGICFLIGITLAYFLGIKVTKKS